MSPPPVTSSRTVSIVTLGCARNEVDSEELAGRLRADGWRLVDDPAEADVALVNTCGFVEAAKKDSIDTLLAAADLESGDGPRPAVVAVGCLAERYGNELAVELPEVDAVLGFDRYPDMSDQLHRVLAGRPVAPHHPSDRRLLLPLSPVSRQAASTRVSVPGHAFGSNGGGPVWADSAVPDAVVRARLDDRVWAALKIASGCDRRCSFCAIPAFRGAFVSRRPPDVLTEARWLAERGVREVLLVSENSTSYGKDLGDPRLLETLLPQLAQVPGLARVRVSYLQPAEIRPGLLDVLAGTPGVAEYFDVSFQHASKGLLRRMNRFGSGIDFLDLIAGIRMRAPRAGIRSNVIVGFPGETEQDLGELANFLSAAMLDVVGVFGYSAEDGTAAAGYSDQLPADEIADRVRHIGSLVEELTAQRAERRVGDRVEVLVERLGPDADGGGALAGGRAEFQGPEVDGSCDLVPPGDPAGGSGTEPVRWRVGDLVCGTVVATDGVDLIVEAP
ncbi:MAG TPA: radical SAM protein [Dermatophilaceae bacterium]|nr:radical SAM protein [Dermatophilaceae bacterium]